MKRLRLSELDELELEFLRKLVKRKEQLRLSQTAIGARMNISRVYVCRLLSGQLSFSFREAYRLCKALDLEFTPTVRRRRRRKTRNKEKQ